MATFASSIGFLSAVALAATACAVPAVGQSFDIRTLFSAPAPGSGAAAAPTGSGGTQEWSGESGASNHPLMTAQAIRAAAANFRNCLAGLWPQALRRGVTRAVFEANVAELEPDLRIMDLLDAQPEFTKSFWDYLDILVNEDRIQNGRAILAKHRATFDAVEKAYGVDRHFIAAIWGVESNYGTQIGERSVIRSTATLACIGRRQDYFREEFLSALEILSRGDVKAEHLKGSWAGAFGPTQFMPTSFKRYAVDFDGDGRRDVVDSVPDVVASTANNLKKDGWVSGQTWGYEVVVPQGFNFLLADRSRVLAMQEWERLGIRRAGGKAFPRADDRAYLLVPTGAQGPDAAEFPRHHEIQSGGSLCARDRLSRRSAPRRGAVRAGLAAARTGAHAGGTLRTAAASCRARLRRGRARWPARRQDPQRAAQLPILGRGGARRVRLGGGPGAAARPIGPPGASSS